MPSCERCWRDAQRDPYGGVELYEALLQERSCTPEQQAGEGATKCRQCKRKTVHMYAKVCMLCGAKPQPRKVRT